MLTGREAEQRRIDELLEQAAAGSSGVLVLRGDPGIGKTALIDYAASRAGHYGSMRVLRATGIEAENELGFAGLYSLLHPVVGYLRALPERQASALQAALSLGGQQAAPDRLAVAAGTHGLLSVAAEDGPLLILVDDLHWLDPASQEALLFALRRLDRDAVACLMTLRPGPAGPVGLPCLELAGLSSDAAERLVETIAGTKAGARGGQAPVRRDRRQPAGPGRAVRRPDPGPAGWRGTARGAAGARCGDPAALCRPP